MWASGRQAGTIRSRIGKGCGVWETRGQDLAFYLTFIQGMISIGRVDCEGPLEDEVFYR